MNELIALENLKSPKVTLYFVYTPSSDPDHIPVVVAQYSPDTGWMPLPKPPKPRKEAITNGNVP